MIRYLSVSKIQIAVVVLLLVCSAWPQSANVSVFATGFNNPRGLKFGPDGNLYVAEGGAGGSLSTVGFCQQAAGPPAGPGPYSGGFTARISKVDAHGVVTTVADNLPSSQTSPAFGNLVSGVADVAFVGQYTVRTLAGAGCSHGLAGTDNAVLRVNADGSTTMIADLSVFQKRHPVRNPEPDDFEPDGTWYSMVAANGVFYAVEPNHGELDSITSSGRIRRVSDISNIQGHIVPTAIAYDGQNFFVGNLNTFPIRDGSSKIMKITPTGTLTTVNIDFTTVLGLAFDSKGRLYVLENTTGKQFPTPGTGKVVRIEGKHAYYRNRYGSVRTHRNDIRSGWKPVCLERWLRSSSDGTGAGSKDHNQALNSRQHSRTLLPLGASTVLIQVGILTRSNFCGFLGG